MSSCLILNNGETVIMASDSSISTFKNNKFRRVGINQQKIFKVKDSLIFCSGLVSLVEETMEFIRSLNEIDIVVVSKYLLEKKITKNKNIFNIEIIIVYPLPDIRLYQISEYHDFIPIELKSVESSLSIYSAGFKTEKLASLAENKFSKSRDVIKNIEEIYEEISCEQIGGFLDIWEVSKEEVNRVYKKRIPEREYSVKYEKYNSHSVVGEVIVGKILAGNTLTIANSANNFVLDETGATLNNASFTIQNTNTKVIIDPNALNAFSIQQNLGGTFTNKFWVDSSGNVNFAGNLTGATGTFTGTLSASVGNIGTLVIDSNGLKTADGVNYLRGNGDFKWGALSITGSSAVFTGDIYANKIVGQIVNTQVADNAITNNKILSGLQADKITVGTMSGSRVFGGTIGFNGGYIQGNSAALNIVGYGTTVMFSQTGGIISIGNNSIVLGGTTYTQGNLMLEGSLYADGSVGLTTGRSVLTPAGTRIMTFSKGILVGFT